MKFYGTKLVSALAMTRQEYNDYRGWQLPADENGADEGYLVEYHDGGKPNHPDHAGYISWSPKEQFDKAYEPTDQMSFGHALVALESGKRVCRAGWNGKGMWLLFVHAGTQDYTAFWDVDFASHVALADVNHLLPWIGMKTADGGFVPWLASQTDMRAKDWMIVE